MDAVEPNLQQVLEDFHACETHAERVMFFQKYPQLHTVYRMGHYEMLAEDENAAGEKNGLRLEPSSGSANAGPPSPAPAGEGQSPASPS